MMVMSAAEGVERVVGLADRYQAVLLDAYGVFWGGNAVGVLPGAGEAMQELVQRGKIVGILSNSTQLAAKEIDKLHGAGIIQGEHFHFLLTSGEAAKRIFGSGLLPFPTPHHTYWVLGEAHPRFSPHSALFEGSPFRETQNLKEADFIFISIPHVNGEDQTHIEVFRDKVLECHASGKPMVCANPDRFAHEGNPPKAVVRQGSIAALYEEVGGTVHYIGKPALQVYAYAMESFALQGVCLPQQVLMVGDTPETDIRGARNAGMASAVLVETGILADRIRLHGFKGVVGDLPESDRPDFFVQRL